LKTAPLGAGVLYLEIGKANGLELILLAEFGKPSEPRGDLMMKRRDGARMGYLGAMDPCQIFTIIKILTAWSSRSRILGNQVTDLLAERSFLLLFSSLLKKFRAPFHFR
jgi:hypothetical protein